MHGILTRKVVAVINSLEIENLRGIREGKLDELTPLVVLVGPNGSGKSTVLDALSIGASNSPQQAAKEVLDRHPGVDQGTRWFVWLGAISEAVRIAVSTSSGGSRALKLNLDPNGQIQVLSKGQEGPGVAGMVLRGQSVFLRDAEGFESEISAIGGVSEVRLVEPRLFSATPSLHRLFTEAVRLGRRDERGTSSPI